MDTITIPDLSNVDEWTGGGSLLKPGEYDVRVTAAKSVTSSNGNPGFELELSCEEGSIRAWQYITQKSLGGVKQVLAALGVATAGGAFQLNVESLVGKRCRIVVRDEQYQGETKTRVIAYQTATGQPSRVLGGATPAAASSSRPSAVGAGDSDIPFAWLDPISAGEVSFDGSSGDMRLR